MVRRDKEGTNASESSSYVVRRSVADGMRVPVQGGEGRERRRGRVFAGTDPEAYTWLCRHPYISFDGACRVLYYFDALGSLQLIQEISYFVSGKAFVH